MENKIDPCAATFSALRRRGSQVQILSGAPFPFRINSLHLSQPSFLVPRSATTENKYSLALSTHVDSLPPALPYWKNLKKAVRPICAQTVPADFFAFSRDLGFEY